MPQLDKVTFLSQVFWLVIMFFVCYILMLRYILPSIKSSLNFRRNFLKTLMSGQTTSVKEEAHVFKRYENLFLNSIEDSIKCLESTKINLVKTADEQVVLTNKVIKTDETIVSGWKEVFLKKEIFKS